LVARRNAIQSAIRIYHDSSSLKNLADTGKIAILASVYNLETGALEILQKIGSKSVSTPS
jgi:carbonic anhydrase